LDDVHTSERTRAAKLLHILRSHADNQRRVRPLRLSLREAHTIYTQLRFIDTCRDDLTPGTHAEGVTWPRPFRGARAVDFVVVADGIAGDLVSEPVVSDRNLPLPPFAQLSEGSVLDLIDELLWVLDSESYL
jgi:hypothetical protein